MPRKQLIVDNTCFVPADAQQYTLVGLSPAFADLLGLSRSCPLLMWSRGTVFCQQCQFGTRTVNVVEWLHEDGKRSQKNNNTLLVIVLA